MRLGFAEIQIVSENKQCGLSSLNLLQQLPRLHEKVWIPDNPRYAALPHFPRDIGGVAAQDNRAVFQTNLQYLMARGMPGGRDYCQPAITKNIELAAQLNPIRIMLKILFIEEGPLVYRRISGKGELLVIDIHRRVTSDIFQAPGVIVMKVGKNHTLDVSWRDSNLSQQRHQGVLVGHENAKSDVILAFQPGVHARVEQEVPALEFEEEEVSRLVDYFSCPLIRHVVEATETANSAAVEREHARCHADMIPDRLIHAQPGIQPLSSGVGFRRDRRRSGPRRCFEAFLVPMAYVRGLSYRFSPCSYLPQADGYKDEVRSSKSCPGAKSCKYALACEERKVSELMI